MFSILFFSFLSRLILLAFRPSSPSMYTLFPLYIFLQNLYNISNILLKISNCLIPGKIYLAYNKADNMWQRCRVLSINKRDAINPMFHVFCIDFGSTEILSIDK